MSARTTGRALAALAAALGLAALAGCGGGEEAASEAPAPRVAVTEVERRDLRETVRGIGTLEAHETVEIRPEVAGTVTEIGFEEGGRVEAEQLLYALDASKLEREQRARRAGLAGARAELSRAERSFERVKALFERDAASRDRYDEAQLALESARAEVERTQAELELVGERLEDTRIRAPFAGLVSESQVDPGDYAAVGDALATLYRVEPIRVAFWLHEGALARVEVGQPVDLEVGAFPEARFPGTVRFVSPVVDPSTRDFLVRAEIANPDGRLRPGVFGTAVVTVEERSDRPVVPEEALVSTREGYAVFVVEDGTAEHRPVQIGLREPGIAEVREGVEAGERVVRSGHMQLSDGDSVRVVERAAAR